MTARNAWASTRGKRDTGFAVARIFSVPPRKLSVGRLIGRLLGTKCKSRNDGTTLAITTDDPGWRTDMLSVHTDNIGDVAVIACEGRIVRSEDAFTLRNAVNLQADARIVVLDLSEVYALAGGGLGMLVFLQRWAQDHDVRLKLFNPRQSVRNRLEHASSMREFDIATLDEIMALVDRADGRYARAA